MLQRLWLVWRMAGRKSGALAGHQTTETAGTVTESGRWSLGGRMGRLASEMRRRQRQSAILQLLAKGVNFGLVTKKGVS
jgi:hypothetical protein